MPPRSSRSATSLGATLVILILLGLVYLFQKVTNVDLGLGGTPSNATSPTLTSAGQASTPSNSWYQLYFTGPTPDHLTGGIPDQVAASFDTAQKTIDVAMYEFDLTSLSGALIRAAQRGVRVRLVTDTDSLEEQGIKDVIAANIPVVDDQREAIMHDKFVVIDSSTLWTGSMNFTENDAYRNDNNFMQIPSPRLAQNYTAEFEEMFTQHQFGPKSPANTPNPTVTLNGTLIENYFSPDDGVAAHVLTVLQSARTSIDFMAFTFTRTDFTDVMIAKAHAGVTVQGVFEKRQIDAGSDSAWNALTTAGLDVREDGNPDTMHNKVIVVDGQIVVMGSYNFTKAAEQDNDENVLIIHNPEIAAAYTADWQKVWDVAEH